MTRNRTTTNLHTGAETERHTTRTTGCVDLVTIPAQFNLNSVRKQFMSALDKQEKKQSKKLPDKSLQAKAMQVKKARKRSPASPQNMAQSAKHHQSNLITKRFRSNKNQRGKGVPENRVDFNNGQSIVLNIPKAGQRD
jgi:hypothetical protein